MSDDQEIPISISIDGTRAFGSKNVMRIFEVMNVKMESIAERQFNLNQVICCTDDFIAKTCAPSNDRQHQTH